MLLNSTPHGFFPLDRGIRQGDPLSPILFIYVVNALCRMCKAAMRGGLVQWASTHEQRPSGCTSTIRGDTLMLFEATEADAHAARFITFCFELVSGLCLNWSKSALLAVNVPEPQRQALARIVGCEVRDFPACVLGLPLSRGRLKKEDWDPLIERFQRRLAGWKGRLLTYGGRLTLLQAVLSALPLFFLSVIRIPLGVLQHIETMRWRFLWKGTQEEALKPHLVNWRTVCLSKADGGLGVLDLCEMNNALLSKWLWRWINEPESQWVQETVSNAWTVEGSGGSWSVPLRRNIFSPEEATQLDALAEKLGEWSGQLGSERDQPRWSPKPTKGFSVKRYYTWRRRHLTPASLACGNPNNIWKPKIPRKIKVFLWLLSHERLLTRVYRSKWREGDPIQCALCGLAQ
ncbi:hypothetical protein QJS10_CPB22g00395 [Acorus calamus]|uniref:Reverse transcriptase zinc-binding domain-containing protein n=1 Tax=Acorus calamus TaxID=4465 RepID=A0AAV9C0I0_ACOCL|nr:hypothetical protein QJS10_CPB22g00395 [Acorus calamus]